MNIQTTISHLTHWTADAGSLGSQQLDN